MYSDNNNETLFISQLPFHKFDSNFEKNFNVIYISRKNSDINASINKEKILMMPSRKNLFGYLPFIVQLRKKIKKHKKIILSAQADFLFSILLLFFRFKADLFILHDAKPHSFKLTEIIGWLGDMICAECSKKNLVYSDYQFSKLRTGIRKKTSTGFLPIHDSKSKFKTTKDIDVLFIGRIANYKNPHGFMKLAKHNPKLKFAICGQNVDNCFLDASLSNLFIDDNFISSKMYDDYVLRSKFVWINYNSITQSGPLCDAIRLNAVPIMSEKIARKTFININSCLLIDDSKNDYYLEPLCDESLYEKLLKELEQYRKKFTVYNAADLINSLI